MALASGRPAPANGHLAMEKPLHRSGAMYALEVCDCEFQPHGVVKGDLEGTATTMEADKRCLADLTAPCEQKASDFESRQRLHTEELEATAMVIEIIYSTAAKGNAAAYLPTLKDKTLNTACRAQRRGAPADTEGQVPV